MDPADTGFFEYDDRYPPFCVREARHVLPEEVVDAQITQYLQDSYKEGLKHEDAILSSGLSAGEAGVMYLRKMNNKRRRLDKSDIDIDRAMRYIAESLKRHMDLDVNAKAYRPIFLRVFTPEVFQTKQYRRKIMQTVKLFLKEANLKTKGYTAKLRNVMTSVYAQLNLAEENNAEPAAAESTKAPATTPT